jgi:hypothetical protein
MSQSAWISATLPAFEAVEFVKPHRHLMAGGRDIQPGVRKGAGVIAAAADPIGPVCILPGDHDGVAAFQIGPGGVEGAIGPVVKRVGPQPLPQGMGEAEHRIFGQQHRQRGLHDCLVEIVLRPAQGGEITCLLPIGFHSAAAP